MVKKDIWYTVKTSSMIVPFVTLVGVSGFYLHKSQVEKHSSWITAKREEKTNAEEEINNLTIRLNHKLPIDATDKTTQHFNTIYEKKVKPYQDTLDKVNAEIDSWKHRNDFLESWSIILSALSAPLILLTLGLSIALIYNEIKGY